MTTEIQGVGSGLDTRKTSNNLFCPEWTNLCKAYTKEDPPPYKVKLIPFQVLRHAYNTLH